MTSLHQCLGLDGLLDCRCSRSINANYFIIPGVSGGCGRLCICSGSCQAAEQQQDIADVLCQQWKAGRPDQATKLLGLICICHLPPCLYHFLLKLFDGIGGEYGCGLCRGGGVTHHSILSYQEKLASSLEHMAVQPRLPGSTSTARDTPPLDPEDPCSLFRLSPTTDDGHGHAVLDELGRSAGAVPEGFTKLLSCTSNA